MDEDVGGAIIGGDKTVAFVRVEPFHGSLSHLLSPSRDEPGIRAPCADQLLAAHRRRKTHEQSETPTVKTAGVFTIADFDNNSNFKYVRGQSIPAPAHPHPDPRSLRTVGPPCPHQIPAEVEAAVCELRRSHPRLSGGPAGQP